MPALRRCLSLWLVVATIALVARAQDDKPDPFLDSTSGMSRDEEDKWLDAALLTVVTFEDDR